MQVGDLVKWNKQNKHYGDLGLVVEVYSNGGYRVHWIKDSDYEDYRKETKNVMLFSSWR